MMIGRMSVPECAIALLPQMREWVKDCQWADIVDPEEVDELFTSAEILKGIEMHYDGGINGFVRDSQPLPKENTI